MTNDLPRPFTVADVPEARDPFHDSQDNLWLSAPPGSMWLRREGSRTLHLCSPDAPAGGAAGVAVNRALCGKTYSHTYRGRPRLERWFTAARTTTAVCLDCAEARASASIAP